MNATSPQPCASLFDAPAIEPLAGETLGGTASPSESPGMAPPELGAPDVASVVEMSAGEPDILSNLTPAQRAAVEHGDGPLLVLAGAGTGKTRVLTRRIAHLIATRR